MLASWAALNSAPESLRARGAGRGSGVAAAMRAGFGSLGAAADLASDLGSNAGLGSNLAWLFGSVLDSTSDLGGATIAGATGWAAAISGLDLTCGKDGRGLNNRAASRSPALA